MILSGSDRVEGQTLVILGELPELNEGAIWRIRQKSQGPGIQVVYTHPLGKCCSGNLQEKVLYLLPHFNPYHLPPIGSVHQKLNGTLPTDP